MAGGETSLNHVTSPTCCSWALQLCPLCPVGPLCWARRAATDWVGFRSALFSCRQAYAVKEMVTPGSHAASTTTSPSTGASMMGSATPAATGAPPLGTSSGVGTSQEARHSARVASLFHGRRDCAGYCRVLRLPAMRCAVVGERCLRVVG